MQLVSYLFFKDNAAQAFDFYARCLDGEITDQVTFGEMPDGPDIPDDAKGLVANISLKAGDSTLMGSDCWPGAPFEPMQGCAVAIDADGAAHAERIFAALAEGGTITMPLGETSWAERFGMLTDRYGIKWMVNCNRPE